MLTGSKAGLLLMLPDVAWSFGRHQALAESDVPLGGPGVCAWTGREVTETWPFRPSDGFADWERIGDRHTNRAHPGYAWLAGHHRTPAGRTLGFRRFSLLASTDGLQVAGKDEKHTIREWVLHPPDPPFSILVADQGQKHLAWRSPVAHDTTMFPVRLDERVAWVTPWFTQLLLKPRYRHLVTTTERSDHLATAGGQAWFLVHANPTFDAVIDGKRRRTGITTEPRLTEWITRKLAASGAEITTVKAEPAGVEKSRRPGATMTHASCRYEGQLTIRDPDALRHAITTGIGRGRAYGFGLLTVAPL